MFKNLIDARSRWDLSAQNMQKADEAYIADLVAQIELGISEAKSFSYTLPLQDFSKFKVFDNEISPELIKRGYAVLYPCGSFSQCVVIDWSQAVYRT